MRPIATATSRDSKQTAAKCLVILSFLTTVTCQSHAPNNKAHYSSRLHDPQPFGPVTTSASAQSQAPAPLSVGSAAPPSSEAPPPSQQSATTTAASVPLASISTRHTQHQSDNTGWIESILNKVERLTEHHDQAHAKAEAESQAKSEGDIDDDIDNDHQRQQLEPSSSLAPTDSGEDPLETSTVDSSDSINSSQQHLVAANVTLSHEQTSATQYSISSESHLSHQKPTTRGDSKSVPASSLDEEQRLVESNNVSAVLESGTVLQLPAPPQQATQQPQQQPPVSCEQAYTQCALRKVCVPALNAYNDDCRELINNRTSQCSAKCLKAMIALRSSEEGDDLVNCDCQGNEYCLQSKQRSLACKPQVEEAVDPKTVVTCSVASWICMADQLCSTALEYYYRNCQSLFSQRHCSMRCNNSLSILYRQPKASKLISCQCDGTEEFPCVKYKTYTERLCLNKLTSVPAQMSADNLEITDNNSNDDQQQQEDEGFNMTNDPETFILGSPAASDSGDTGEDEEVNGESEADGKRAASGRFSNHAEESSSSGQPNGIQPFEDNWIPLISSRYFTNLQQRKQQEQQQQQRHIQRQQVQQSKRTQKTVKQKTKSNSSSGSHHDNRRRYGRILMSTSSRATSTCRPSTIWHTWVASACLVLIVYRNYQFIVTLML